MFITKPITHGKMCGEFSEDFGPNNSLEFNEPFYFKIHLRSTMQQAFVDLDLIQLGVAPSRLWGSAITLFLLARGYSVGRGPPNHEPT